MFDAAKHASCPYCGIPGLNIARTEPVRLPPVPKERATQPDPALSFNRAADTLPTQPMSIVDDGPTQGYFKAKMGIEPVVGWLVCVKGPDQGRDFRIRSNRNFIGRDQKMDICLAGDKQISRENHAIVTYDPRNNNFRISPGGSHGIVYLNGQPVDVPMTLKAHDLIELGVTALRFVPFCGDSFTWA